jgi:hypothetical protein
MLLTTLTQSFATQKVWIETNVTGQSQALTARYHLSYFRVSADAPRKMPSSFLAIAAIKAMLEFLEIKASTLIFSKSPLAV